MEHEGSLSELEALIGYTFQDIKHLETAITHKSFVNEKMVGRYMSYERYEFLGDAILEFIVSKYLFENYQTMPEGDLSKRMFCVMNLAVKQGDQITVHVEGENEEADAEEMREFLKNNL